MHRTVVLLVVGLTGELVGEATPNLAALAREGGARPLRTILPAVTCSVQSTLTTGLPPRDHGVVANGWYFRDLAEVWLWRQSNRLVAGEKIWEAAQRRDPAFTCAKLFWWYNMYSAATWSVTPRPMYPADGRKIPDVYTQPAELRDELNARLGSSRSSISGARRPISRRAAGSPTARATSTTRSGRRSRSSTCRISTTTCSGSGPGTRRSRRISGRSTRSAGS